MCSIILRLTENATFIAANRDEMLARPWSPPGAHWPEHPGVIAGRDETAGGTWMALNEHGVMAAVLNRHGTLGPAPNKRSRGELPLLALSETSAEAAAAKIAGLDAAGYRAFNLVTADVRAVYLVRGLGAGAPDVTKLQPGVTMITAGEPNDLTEPRIARHLPKFLAEAWEGWPALLADHAPPWESALNIEPQNGFGTVCAALIALPRTSAPAWRFAAGPPDQAPFTPVPLPLRKSY
jgi:uncharacterized protein with NRDE domain